jgi:hypothetical protein
VIDPYGRIIKQLGLSQEGIIDAALTNALQHLTPYAPLGDRVLLGLLLVALLVPPRRAFGRESPPRITPVHHHGRSILVAMSKIGTDRAMTPDRPLIARGHVRVSEHTSV